MSTMSTSKLTLYNVPHLINSMESLNITKEHFVFVYAKKTFDCIFIISDDKYEILVALHDFNYGFTINIYQNRNKDYIAELKSETYYTLKQLLNLNSDEDGFTSHTLLVLLSKNIPTVSKGETLSYKKLQKYISYTNIPEKDKIYFRGWNDHNLDGRTARNFEKTEFLLGIEMANHCRTHNISSIWTNEPKEEVDISPPPYFSP